MTTSNKQNPAPMEFWINTITCEVHLDELNGVDGNVHVIEHSAFLELEQKMSTLMSVEIVALKERSELNRVIKEMDVLEQKLAKAVAALKFYGNPKQYDATDVIEGVEILEITGDSGELARETLASLGESEVGEG